MYLNWNSALLLKWPHRRKLSADKWVEFEASVRQIRKLWRLNSSEVNDQWLKREET